LARHEAPQLQTLRADVSPELDQLVAELLARQPEDRPASAAHVAERLAAFTAAADLRGLLAKAQVAAETAPVASRRAEMHAPWREPALPAATAARGSGGRTRRRWWLAAAAAPLLLLAGVLILLETQKGQLVIDSEVADVRVQLLQEGQPVRELEIQPGATATRLRADRYQIIIDSPSDAVVVDKDWFELRSGESVVARIQQRPAGTNAAAVASADPAQDVNASSVGDEPLYDGKPLSQWLETLQRDRSPESIGQALDAIEAMVSPSTAQRITEAMLEVLPKLDGDLRISRGNKYGDIRGLQILAKANPGRRLFELLAVEIERGNSAWSKRLLSLQCFSNIYSHRIASLTTAEPLVAAVERYVLGPESDAPEAVVEAAQMFIRELLVHLHAKENEKQVQASVDRLLGMLDASPRVTMEHWLVSPTFSHWPLEMRQAVLKRAAETLANEDASTALVSQAAMILTGDPKLALQTAPQLPASLNDRLVSLSQQSQRMLARTEVSPHFHAQAHPILQLPFNVRIRSNETARSSSSNTFANEMLALLQLAKYLADDTALASGLQTVQEATAKDAASLVDRLSAASTSLNTLLLDWPTLRITAATGPRNRFQEHELAELQDLLPPPDLMHYAIHAAASELLSGRTDGK